MDHKAHESKSVDSYIPVIQTDKNQYITAVDYLASRLSNWSSHYYRTVSSYISSLRN